MSGITEAIVLAGGLGTRLRSAVPDLPKGLAPIAGKPFLAWQLAGLAGRGVTRAVLALGHRAGLIQEVLGSRCEGVELAYSLEPGPLGTGGALRLAAQWCQTPRVLALNGDTFLDFEPAAADRALEAPAVGVVVLASVPDVARFGSVECDEQGWVRRFREKGGEGAGWINGGVYALDLAALAPLWPAGEEAFSVERVMLPALAEAGRLRAVRAEGAFLDIGTPEDYALAQRRFASGGLARASDAGR